MLTCLDFAKESTALESVGIELGVKVIITPKFHAEIAGEGIEYAWGISKGVYRRKPLAEKKGKQAKFEALVKECLSRSVLTTECTRKLSRRARARLLHHRIDKSCRRRRCILAAHRGTHETVQNSQVGVRLR